MKQGTPKFAFEAQLWSTAIERTFNLTKVFRQSDPGTMFGYQDHPTYLTLTRAEFVDMLNEMRFGRLSNKSVSKFKSLSRALSNDDGVAATELYVSF